MVQEGSQKYKINDVLKKLLSGLACSQIWLNLPLDHCHFGYNTKLPKKTTGPNVKRIPYSLPSCLL
jgi:hypothetical protein